MDMSFIFSAFDRVVQHYSTAMFVFIVYYWLVISSLDRGFSLDNFNCYNFYECHFNAYFCFCQSENE